MSVTKRNEMSEALRGGQAFSVTERHGQSSKTVTDVTPRYMQSDTEIANGGSFPPETFRARLGVATIANLASSADRGSVAASSLAVFRA